MIRGLACGTDTVRAKGLGLHYASSAIRRLKGTIHASSVKNKGTILTIIFPLILPAAAKRPTKAPPLRRSGSAILSSYGRNGQAVPAPAPATARNNGQTRLLSTEDPAIGRDAGLKLNRASEKRFPVLVVEDDPVNARIVQKTFSAAGHEVDWAEDGKIGYEKCQERQFRLVIMDLMMDV